MLPSRHPVVQPCDVAARPPSGKASQQLSLTESVPSLCRPVHQFLQRLGEQLLEDEDVMLPDVGVEQARAQSKEIEHAPPVLAGEDETGPPAKRHKQQDQQDLLQLVQSISALAPEAQASALEAWKVGARPSLL